MIRGFCVLMALAVLGNGVAEAAPRQYTTYRGDDQARCQQEANIMASRRFCGHVGSCIGSFEGVGRGSSPNCNTCTPSRPMRLTGDAAAQGPDGRWYRVRSWR